MEDVGDGEVIAEGANDEDRGCEQDRGEGDDAGAARSLADAFRTPAKQRDQRSPAAGRSGGASSSVAYRLRGLLRIPILEDQRDDPGEERVNAQR